MQTRYVNDIQQPIEKRQKCNISVLLNLQFFVYVLQIVVCPFVQLLLAIVFSVLIRYTDSDYSFSIFKLFLDPTVRGKGGAIQQPVKPRHIYVHVQSQHHMSWSVLDVQLFEVRGGCSLWQYCWNCKECFGYKFLLYLFFLIS